MLDSIMWVVIVISLCLCDDIDVGHGGRDIVVQHAIQAEITARFERWAASVTAFELAFDVGLGDQRLLLKSGRGPDPHVRIRGEPVACLFCPTPERVTYLT